MLTVLIAYQHSYYYYYYFVDNINTVIVDVILAIRQMYSMSFNVSITHISTPNEVCVESHQAGVARLGGGPAYAAQGASSAREKETAGRSSRSNRDSGRRTSI